MDRDVAPVVDHESVDAVPAVIEPGLAVNELIVGGVAVLAALNAAKIPFQFSLALEVDVAAKEPTEETLRNSEKELLRPPIWARIPFV